MELTHSKEPLSAFRNNTKLCGEGQTIGDSTACIGVQSYADPPTLATDDATLMHEYAHVGTTTLTVRLTPHARAKSPTVASASHSPASSMRRISAVRWVAHIR